MDILRRAARHLWGIFVVINPDLAHFDCLRPRTADGSLLVRASGFSRIPGEDILIYTPQLAGI